MDNQSIFGTIREHFGLTVRRAERYTSADTASSLVAKRLEVELGQALIHIRSIAYNHNNLPLEFYKAHYNTNFSPTHLVVDSGKEFS